MELIQFRVGQVLLDHLSRAQVADNIFIVANLLLKGHATNLSVERRLEICHLCLQAGRAAIVAASFAPAALYLRGGIGFLPDQHWTTEYHLSLELFSAAAEAEHCIGELDSMQEHCNAVI